MRAPEYATAEMWVKVLQYIANNEDTKSTNYRCAGGFRASCTGDWSEL